MLQHMLKLLKRVCYSHARTPLVAAVEAGALDSLHALVDRRANLDYEAADGSTALIRAAHLGNVDAVRALLEAGASRVTVDYFNRHGDTALMTAARLGHCQVVRNAPPRNDKPEKYLNKEEIPTVSITHQAAPYCAPRPLPSGAHKKSGDRVGAVYENTGS
eukprot:6830737-Pyramimonas_sp.AAC.1